MKKRNFSWAMVIGLAVLLLTCFRLVAGAETNGLEAENTKPPLQIINQSGIKVVVQVNYSDTVPSGISKQVMAVKNLYDQYAVLGLKSGKDYEITMVFRADGAQFLLNDEAYDLKVKQPHPKGNPNKAMIETMHKGGVRIYECHVAMKLKGYKSEDIFPFSRIVISGIGAIIDFKKSGYMEITP